jgi:NAD(P)-dependent dehydrogenase (short-subunit alcohol dehydrogenase family)
MNEPINNDHTQKRVALVTGSTSGIGMAIAQRLADDGFAVAFHSKSSVATGQALAAQYPDAAYFQADLSDQTQSRHLIAAVLTHYDRLDILVNNAGISATIHMTKMLAMNLAPQIRVNAIAPGLVDTPMSKNWTAARQLWQERSPMGRGAQPAEIAQVAAMMVASHYLTGEIIMADGGLNLT